MDFSEGRTAEIERKVLPEKPQRALHGLIDDTP
jgi:hypothetical protein